MLTVERVLELLEDNDITEDEPELFEIKEEIEALYEKIEEKM